MNLVAVYAFLFGSVLLLSDMLLRRVFGARRSAKEINSRLERLRSGTDQVAAYNSLVKDRGLRNRDENGVLTLDWLMRIYRQSGLEMSLQRRISWFLLIFAGSWVLCTWFVDSALLQPLAAFVLALVVAFLLVLRRRSVRIAKFISQLPGALETIVRSLNAGHPLNSAISLVAREMPDPIGSEFGILSDQLTFGSELDVAMLNMVDRVGADELNLVAITVSVQRGTGGNLSEVLENLSAMIRDRAMLRAKIRAVSAEGRITAMVMALFPFALFLLIRTLVPTYFDPVWESGHGTVIVSTIIGFMAFGIIILYRLVKFDF